MATWVAPDPGSELFSDGRIEGFVVLTFKFQRLDRTNWFGECLELGTATNARTLNRTHDELADLVILHLNALEDAGERGHFFKEHRITFHRSGKEPLAVTLAVPLANEDVFFHAQAVPLAKAA